MVNWSYILKYLLATTTKLRSQLKRDKPPPSPLEDRPTAHKAPPQNVLDASAAGVDGTSAVKSLDNITLGRAMTISTPKPADKPPPSSVEKTQFARYRMRSAVSSQQNERRRQSEAGKLGPRLTQSRNAVQHNSMATADIDQIGPPDEADYDDDYSHFGSEADGSFRSAATVGSIPPHVSSSVQHSEFAQGVVSGLGVQGHQAIAAMSVIDRVSSMTEEQIRRMDPETQAQVSLCYQILISY